MKAIVTITLIIALLFPNQSQAWTPSPFFSKADALISTIALTAYYTLPRMTIGNPEEISQWVFDPIAAEVMVGRIAVYTYINYVKTLLTNEHANRNGINISKSIFFMFV